MDDIFRESTSQLLRSGRIKTSSRIYKLWLQIRGFQVERKVHSPKGYSLGRLTYRTSWVLRPKNAEPVE